MRPVRPLVLLLPVLALTACGGGGDDAPSAGPTLAAASSPERATYARAAEAVCARAVAASARIAQPRSAAQYVASFQQTLAVGRTGLQGLRALTPPEQDREALEEAFLGPIAQKVANFETALPAVRAAAASADPGAALARIPDPGAAVTVNLDYIDRYGMPTCAVFAGKDQRTG